MNAPQGKALFVYVGAFTTPERKGNGDGINVYRVDPTSGVWTHQQQVPNIVNPSFLAFDRAPRFLYSVHADLDEVSAYAIDKQTGQLTRSTGNPAAARTRCTCRSIRRPLDRHGQLQRRVGRGRADREGRHLGAAQRSGELARRTGSEPQGTGELASA